MIDSRVVSVNVGTPKEFMLDGRRKTSAIWKHPVEGRVAARGVNLDGDDQADRKHHGGPDQAVYAYALEDYEWWFVELGRELAPGTFGENLTLAGVEVNDALVG
ncbi:MAG: MOSC domain-containing protein, partial [Actinomycetota bacterium]